MPFDDDDEKKIESHVEHVEDSVILDEEEYVVECELPRDECDHRPSLACELAWLVLATHLAFVLVLMAKVCGDPLQLGQLCLLLTVIFVFVRHQFTRLFSLLTSAAGVAAATRVLVHSCQAYAVAFESGAATSLTGLAQLARLRSRETTSYVLILCFCVVQAINLALRLWHERPQRQCSIAGDEDYDCAS